MSNKYTKQITTKTQLTYMAKSNSSGVTKFEWLKLILVTHFSSLVTQNIVSTPAAPTK